MVAVGASGVISVASNVIPKEVANLVRAFAMGKPGVALALHERFYPVFKDLFVESNPTPCKAALAMLGLCSEEVRLPLVPVNEQNRKLIRQTLRATGLLK